MVYDWEVFYDELQEDFPENAPEARGDSVAMTQVLDTNHAGDMMNCRSNMGILICICRYLILWYSKNQNTFKSIMSGS